MDYKTELNSDEKLIEKKINSKAVFSGKIIKVYFDEILLPNDKKATREKVCHPGAVAVVPVNENNEIILIRQYRYPVEEVLIEIPAGKLDKDELPVKCAERELQEEVGAIGGKLMHLTSFLTTPGFSNELLHLFIALDFKKRENNPDDDEFLQIIKVPLDKCLSWIYDGKIKDAKSIIGILMARDYINNSKK
ncbi:MAG: NUDIX hydrolase [Actinomycetota bacterium]|nr:NUDIX hydrolase [Actinomycetota bacterium]